MQDSKKEEDHICTVVAGCWNVLIHFTSFLLSPQIILITSPTTHYFKSYHFLLKNISSVFHCPYPKRQTLSGSPAWSGPQAPLFSGHSAPTNLSSVSTSGSLNGPSAFHFHVQALPKFDLVPVDPQPHQKRQS